MTMIIRQMLLGLFFALLMAAGVLGVTFYSFPLMQWDQLYRHMVLGLPYGVIVIIFTVIIGLFSGLISGWSLQSRRNRLKESLENILNGQPILLTREDRDISNRMKRVQEKLNKLTELSQQLATERATDREKSLQEVVIQERNRLARELHDSVSQQLFAASMMMSAINESEESRTDSPLYKQLSIVEHMIHQSQLEMRALLLHLRPVALKGKTLYEGMKELLGELVEKVPMTIETKIEPLLLDKGIEDQLFRILQESVSNTLRHAKADRMSIILIERDEWIILRITDNGDGFDVDEAKTSSYGMQNMNERALEIGGLLKIISLPGQGTKLEVKVPRIKRREGDD